MQLSSVALYQDIVQPCLAYLSMENVQLGVFLTAVQELHEYGSEKDTFSPYQISHLHHWEVWDQYLALHPEMASRVRGMASQHRFLEDPDHELTVNNGYATAIAAIISKRGLDLAHRSDFQYLELIKIWKTVNPNINDAYLVNKITLIGNKLQKTAA